MFALSSWLISNRQSADEGAGTGTDLQCSMGCDKTPAVMVMASFAVATLAGYRLPNGSTQEPHLPKRLTAQRRHVLANVTHPELNCLCTGNLERHIIAMPI
jgi:hypothetical protein